MSSSVEESYVLPPAQEGTPEATQLTEGVHENVSPEIYHMQKSISRGDLVVAGVPAKFKFRKDHPQIDKPTPAKIFGQAFHTKLLEPQLFATRYCLSRYENYYTTKAKEWRDEQKKAGMVVLSRDDWDALDMMVQSAKEHPHFFTVFGRAGTRRELTMIARDPATGLLLRVRYDFLPPGNAIPDIKSAMDASAEGFGKSAWNLEYGFQAAHYLNVHNLLFPEKRREEFIFCVFEKDPPYLPAIYLTPHSLIEYCRKIIRARLYTIAHCMKTDTWPGYYDGTPLNQCEFELPRFAEREIEGSEK